MNARREALLAGAGSVVAAVVMKAPALTGLGSRVPKDIYDPLASAWRVAWGGHGLLTGPFQAWDSNVFWPLRHSYAFSDSLYGYAPLAVLFGSGTKAALVRYSVLFVLAYALAAAGAYLLARQLGCPPLAAAVAAAAYGFAPWHLSQDGHLHVLSNGAVPLSLALLARGHGIGARWRSRSPRPGCAVAGWAVAAWQLTLGFAVGLQLAYLLGALALVGAALAASGRWKPLGGRGRQLLVADVVGVVAFIGIGVAFAVPYVTVVRWHPEARRTVGDLRLFSPPLRGFLIAPAESTLSGDLHAGVRERLNFPPEMALGVGVALLPLAAAGVAGGRWSVGRRVGLAVGSAIALLLAAGTTLAGGRLYLLLYDHAPGWQGVRTPGRLVILVTLGLALLAANGAEAVCRTGRRSRALGFSFVVLILLDGHGALPMPTVPAPSPGVAAAAPPLLVLPSDDLLDMQAMWESTRGFPTMMNGGAAFTPRLLADVRRGASGFPDPASVGLLRQIGVRNVVLRPALSPGTPWAGAEARPVDGLGLTVRRVGGDFVYDLAPPAS